MFYISEFNGLFKIHHTTTG